MSALARAPLRSRRHVGRCAPSTSSSGRQASRSAARPPTITVNVPSTAPRTPPDTGASIRVTPRRGPLRCKRPCHGGLGRAHVDDHGADGGGRIEQAVRHRDLLDGRRAQEHQDHRLCAQRYVHGRSHRLDSRLGGEARRGARRRCRTRVPHTRLRRAVPPSVAPCGRGPRSRPWPWARGARADQAAARCSSITRCATRNDSSAAGTPQ